MQRYRVEDSAPGSVLLRMADVAARSFGAPMAVVTIVDHDQVRLIATRGLGEAARAVSRDDPVLASVAVGGVEVLTQAEIAGSAVLAERAVRFYAAAPIVTFDGHRLGSLAVMDTEPRQVAGEHLLILEDLAAVLMEQLELRLSSLDAVSLERRLRGDAETARDVARRDRASAETERGEAERDRDEARRERDQAQVDRGIAERDRDSIEEYAAALQRTLLPPSLPRIDGLEVASYFRPISSHQIGGDFYDVFSLGGRRWAFFIGDVLGHDVDAAVVTSLIRYTLRSAALHYSDPTDGLAELNSVLLREVAPRRFCTVLFGTVEPAEAGDGFVVTMATGGHPPALLIHGTGRVEAVRPRDGMLVGALPTAVFDQCTVTLDPGQTLLFYTDGLIEARLGGVAFDESALSDFVAERAGGGFDALMHEITTLAPKLDQRDDIAVLAVHVS